MGLEQNEGRLTYLNIREGKLSYKNANKEVVTADKISGTITKIEFVNEEYNGQTYEKMKMILVDGDEKFCLQMNTDSGYFRGFCNSLKNGDHTKKIKIAPFYQVKDGKKQSTCFVEQNGAALKHFYTKDKPGDLPQVEKVTFKGKDNYDGTKQIAFWKEWLSGLKLESEFIASATDFYKTDSGKKETPTFMAGNDDNDDLPF